MPKFLKDLLLIFLVQSLALNPTLAVLAEGLPATPVVVVAGCPPIFKQEAIVQSTFISHVPKISARIFRMLPGVRHPLPSRHEPSYVMSIIGRRGDPRVDSALIPLGEEWLLRYWPALWLGWNHPAVWSVGLFPILHGLLHGPADRYLYGIGWKQFWTQQLWRRALVSASFGVVGSLAEAFLSPDLPWSFLAAFLAHAVFNLFIADFLEQRFGWNNLTMSILGKKQKQQKQQAQEQTPAQKKVHTTPLTGNPSRDLMMVQEMARSLDSFPRMRGTICSYLVTALSSKNTLVKFAAMQALSKAKWPQAIPSLIQALDEPGENGLRASQLLFQYPIPLIYKSLKLGYNDKSRFQVRTRGQAALVVYLLAHLKDGSQWSDVIHNRVRPGPVMAMSLIENFADSQRAVRSRILDVIDQNKFVVVITKFLTDPRLGESAEKLLASNPKWAPELIAIAKTPKDLRALGVTRVLLLMGGSILPEIMDAIGVENKAYLLKSNFYSASTLTERSFILYGAMQRRSRMTLPVVIEELWNDHPSIVIAAAGAILRIEDVDSFSAIVMALEEQKKAAIKNALAQNILQWNPDELNPVDDLLRAFDGQHQKVQAWGHQALRKKGLSVISLLYRSMEKEQSNPALFIRYNHLLLDIAEDHVIEILHGFEDPKTLKRALEVLKLLKIHAAIPLARHVTHLMVGSLARMALDAMAEDPLYRADLPSRLLQVIAEEQNRPDQIRDQTKISFLSRLLLEIRDADASGPHMALGLLGAILLSAGVYSSSTGLLMGGLTLFCLELAAGSLAIFHSHRTIRSAAHAVAASA